VVSDVPFLMISIFTKGECIVADAVDRPGLLIRLHHHLFETFAGSAPKPPMLSRTHASAATMSNIPALPDAVDFSPPIDARLQKPATPIRMVE
jgi:hypothetical protein